MITDDGSRLVISDPQDFENQVTVTDGCAWSDKTGRFAHIEVSEEKAVDSYNRTFECGFDLDRTQAAALRDWLNNWLETA